LFARQLFPAWSPDGNGQRPLAAHPADELWPSWGPGIPARTGVLKQKQGKDQGQAQTKRKMFAQE